MVPAEMYGMGAVLVDICNHVLVQLCGQLFDNFRQEGHQEGMA